MACSGSPMTSACVDPEYVSLAPYIDSRIGFISLCNDCRCRCSHTLGVLMLCGTLYTLPSVNCLRRVSVINGTVLDCACVSIFVQVTSHGSPMTVCVYVVHVFVLALVCCLLNISKTWR